MMGHWFYLNPRFTAWVMQDIWNACTMFLKMEFVLLTKYRKKIGIPLAVFFTATQISSCAALLKSPVDLTGDPIASKIVNNQYIVRVPSFVFSEEQGKLFKKNLLLWSVFDLHGNRCFLRSKVEQQWKIEIKKCGFDVPVFSDIICLCNRYQVLGSLPVGTSIQINSVTQVTNETDTMYRVHASIPSLNLENVEIHPFWYDLNRGGPITVDLDFLVPKQL